MGNTTNLGGGAITPNGMDRAYDETDEVFMDRSCSSEHSHNNACHIGHGHY